MHAGRLVRICLTVALVAGTCLALSPVAQAEEVTQREDIWITQDSHFNPSNGVRRGSGTARDPFVISGWDVSTLYVKDTAAHVVVRDNVVDRLVLNWNGRGVKLVDNTIGNLRVNENVDRTGAATSGVIANNTIGIVGQLRHFDGLFAHNTITGDDLFDGTLFSGPAVAFDGFNGARFVHNTINGYVDITLHGHHHGSGYGKKSHYHSMPPKEHEQHAAHTSHDAPNVDHTKRYHQLWVANNKITSPGQFALRYNDRAHRANDRTAASEKNEALNAKHVHHTRVHLNNNTLIGSGLRVDTFNAEDENHLDTARGLVEIRGNTIKLGSQMADTPWDQQRQGITVERAVDVTMRIAGNTITSPSQSERSPLASQFADDAGILLWEVGDADIFITGNSVANTVYGVRAQDFSKSVHWTIRSLKTQGVAQPVYYDNSVANHPRRSD